MVAETPYIYKNGAYTISVVVEPEGKFKCYGVENRQTGVIEAYVSQLARAMYIADQFEQELKNGLVDERKEAELEQAFLNARANTKPPGAGGRGGGLNG